MATIRCHLDIDAPRTKIFDITQDYALRPEWDPFHSEYKKLEDGKVWYRARNGMTMTVRYVSFNPPERVAMQMLQGPLVFSSFAGAWIFKALSETRTEVAFQYHFALRLPFRLGTPLVRIYLEREMTARLAGLKRFVERH